MLSLLWTALIGLVVGALAKFIMPGKDPGGIWITMLLGIAGSFLGSWIGRLLGWYQEGQSAGFIMSLIGALILLAIYHFYKRSTASYRTLATKNGSPKLPLQFRSCRACKLRRIAGV